MTSVSWNCDSSKVVSSDLSGLVKVWDIEKKKCVFDCDEGPVEFVQSHPKGKNYLLTALADGNMYFYNIKDGDFKILSGPSGVPCVTGKFVKDGRQFIVVYQVRHFKEVKVELIS